MKTVTTMVNTAKPTKINFKDMIVGDVFFNFHGDLLKKIGALVNEGEDCCTIVNAINLISGVHHTLAGESQVTLIPKVTITIG